ncbi:hypothetical protein PIB30_047042 [Stylosanthes scabra]|uniref:Adenylate kinase n=1 Tax=Stylosanthes scabra TaxID=79078 RepID=A0ABU6RGP1_9FABA|nr:hypothetical protein [Stylosanthes scabra]
MVISHLRTHNHFSLTIPKALKVNCSTSEPLKIMISGAPASGKGTQCEVIVQKWFCKLLQHMDKEEVPQILTRTRRSSSVSPWV